MLKVSGHKEHYKFSYIFLSVLLIAFGIAAGYFIVTALFAEIKLISFIGLLFYIPLLCVVCIMPIYAGFALIIDAIKDLFRKDDAN